MEIPLQVFGVDMGGIEETMSEREQSNREERLLRPNKPSCQYHAYIDIEAARLHRMSICTMSKQRCGPRYT